jgi:hypothetical protein
VWALAFSPTGTALISGGGDGVVMLWEVWNMSRLLHVPLSHMSWTEYERAQRGAVEDSLSPERQAVARYVAAVLRYRLGKIGPDPL